MQIVSKTDDHLNRIKLKLQLILKQQSMLEKENKQLKEDLLNVRKQKVEYEQQLEELRQKVEISKYSNGEMDEAEKKLMEKKLSLYLKEIDRCIAMLGQ